MAALSRIIFVDVLLCDIHNELSLNSLYEGHMQSSWTDLITLSRSFLEVR